MKHSSRKNISLLLAIVLSLLLFSSCVAMKEFFKGFAQSEDGFYEGDYYDDGYVYGDDSGRDDSQD